MRLYEKFKKIEPSVSCNRNKDLIVPRYISLMQKCIEHKVQDCFIRNTHFTDLCVLLYSLDIANIKMALKRKAADDNKKRGVSVRDISQADAVKFLKGGGQYGG